MDQTLHDLFTVIITTENAAKYEQQQHNEVKAEIQQKRERLAKQKVSIDHRICKVADLTARASGLEIDVSLLKTQEKFLMEKLNFIVLETKQDAAKKLRMEEAFQQISFEFMKRKHNCVESIGTQSWGLDNREYAFQDVIQALRSKNAQIVDEMTAIHHSWEQLLLFLGRKKEMMKQKEVLEHQIKEAEDSLKLEADMTLELELQGKQLKNLPNTDELFKTLKAQLNDYRVSMDNEEKKLLASWS